MYMACDFIIRKRPVQVSFLSPVERQYEIICNRSALLDLRKVLRSVISNKYKIVPMTNFEEDVLSDLYNSISLLNFK